MRVLNHMLRDMLCFSLVHLIRIVPFQISHFSIRIDYLIKHICLFIILIKLFRFILLLQVQRIIGIKLFLDVFVPLTIVPGELSALLYQDLTVGGN